MVPYPPRAPNLPAVMNAAVATLRGTYTHYLFLRPEIEAAKPGWLEHMLGYGQRNDVGIVGAVLLGRNQDVRHSGLIIGSEGQVSYAFEGASFRHWIAGRNPGPNGSLLASRDVSAVTSACMLVRADLHYRLNGFDEELPDPICDADYCLRACATGYKVVQDAYAVLYQPRRKSRAASVLDHHSEAARRFHQRHQESIEWGDPFSIPATKRLGGLHCFKEDDEEVRTRRPRTRSVALPQGSSSSRIIRIDNPKREAHGRGPLHATMGDPMRTQAVP